MKKIATAATLVGLALFGISWLAEAKLNAPLSSPQLVYNSSTKVYQLHGPTQFAMQPLEQKMLAMQTINRHQVQLATQVPVDSH